MSTRPQLSCRRARTKTEYVMLTSADFAKFNPSQINLELALGMRHHVIQNLQRSLGQQVTAAFYIDIASGDPGMAFWKNETLLIAAPYSVSFLTKGDEYARQIAAIWGIGLALSPNHRSSFGSSIKPPNNSLQPQQRLRSGIWPDWFHRSSWSNQS